MREKIVPTIKSVIIIALAALAVFQVSRLWLVNFTNRSFFLYLQARFPPAVPDGQSEFARPFRIISGAGDGLFEIRYSEIAASGEWEFGERAINAVFQDGAQIIGTAGMQPLSMQNILAWPVFVYEYAFDMCAETFARAMGRRNASLLTDAGIENFRAIAVVPPRETGFEPVLAVYFISDEEIVGFGVPLGTPRRAAADFEIEIPPANPDGLHFIHTAAGFVPHAPRGGFAYHSVLVQNPFRNPQGLFTLSYIRPLIEPFFDNPATIIPRVSADDIYTFSNRNTMVRYLENHIVEYTSYRSIGRAASENLMTDFSAALAFVQNDPRVVNEIFLQSHEPRGRAHVFLFNYVIDNRPMVLTAPWYTDGNCADPLLAPIEIVVDHGRVVRYRRLAYTFHTGGLAWKGSAALENGEFFMLGFPIGSGPEIELAVLVEVR